MEKGGRPPCITILVVILVFGGWDETSGQSIQLHSTSPGRLNRCRAFPISSDYCSFVPSAYLNSTLEDSEICNFTLPQYACGLVPNQTSSQLSAILRCHITDTKAQLDQESFLRLFSPVDQDTLQSALSEISSKIPQNLIPETTKAFMLNAVWEKLKTDPRVQSAGFLSAWFQELLYPYLTGITTNVLDCMTQLPITCDGFAVVIQALDSRYLEMDNSTRQTVVNWIGRFLAKHTCQKITPQEWILTNWKHFLRFVSYGDLLKAWGTSDGSAFLTEADGGTLEYMTPSQVAEMTATAGVLSNVNLTRIITRVLLGKDARYLEAFLDRLAAFPLNPEREASRLMLETVLRKVNQSFPDLCSPSLKDLFQGKLEVFLPVMDAEMLELIPNQIGCADFHDIYEGMNRVDSGLDLDTKKALFKTRLVFLTRQLEKEGTACTFATSNSKEWLQKNFGSSSPFANYSDFRRLYPAFEGYEVLDLLTATQMASLVIYSGILTDSARLSAETEARKVMETLQGRTVSELQTFLLEVRALAEQGNIVENVRSVMLQGIWQILKPHFDSVAVTDFEPWFSGALTLFLPSVTAEQLRALPSPSNCTQLQTVAKGLDYAFGPMSAETRIGAAQWIVQEFKKQGCQTTGSWMTLNFLRFKSLVNLTDLMEMDQNFSGMAHLQDLSAVQLAQLTLTEEVFGSVVNVKLVFDRLAQLSTREDLAAYWDEFSRVYEELNISLEVKQTLLSRTIQWLRQDLLTFTDADYHVWFEKRLTPVLPSVTADILQQIPVNLSCTAYKSVMAGIDTGFPEITKDRKRGILNYIESFLNQKSETTGPACTPQTTTRNWLLQFFRSFSTEVSYMKLVSYFRQPFDAYLVLDLLTPSQIGDMIVHSQTLTSVPLATQLIAFFRESRLDNVQTILKEFTRAAVQRKMLVLPNSEVAQLLLTSYLSLASSQMETYTAVDWNATFHGELRFLSAFINVTTLSYIIPQDFESITTITAELSKARAQMTEASRRDIVLWIVQNSKDLKASGSQNKSADEWIQAVWGSFFLDATLEEVKSTHEDFRPASNLGSLNIGQLVEFVTASDALVNVTTMRMVLSSLENERSEIPLSQMQDFLTHFNLEIEQNEVDIGEGVRLEILSTVFTNLKTHFRTFTHLNYSVWFSKMKLLLPSINKDVLQLIPLDLGFPSYTAIIAGLDQASLEFSQETSLEVYTFIKKVLEVQVNISGTAFPGAYKDSRSFLSGVFSRFARFAEYTDFITFYKDFNGYDVLPLLTTKQMGEMMVVTNAIQRELLAVQILVELEKRPLDELKVFTSELNVVMCQKDLSFLPDLQVSSLILEAVFKRLQFATFSADQYAFWFGTQLQPFLPALSLRLLHQIPLDIDCRSHQNLVNALDQVYAKFTMDQKKAIHKRILNYLEFSQQNQGVTCSPNVNSSQWLVSNYGQFRALASLSEFSSLNVNFKWFSAVEALFPSQLADAAASSEALADGNLFVEIVSQLGTPGDVAEFLNKLNAIAPGELRSSPHASFVLSHAFQIIAPAFPGFKESDFTYWFQGAFQYVLHAVNETMIAQIPLSLSCDSYQQILKAFNKVYANIPAEGSQTIFQFSKAFLRRKVKSGIACGRPTQGTLDWLTANLGNFSSYVDYEDLLSWNLRFDGMAVLESLSPPQLASLTLRSDAINEEEKMCQIMARLENKPLEAIYQYLDQFNVEAQKLAITSLKEEGIRKKMLSLFMEATGAEFSTFRPGNWTHLLSKRLALFLPSAGEKELEQILSRVSGCESFRAVVSSLGHIHSSIPAPNQESIYKSLFAFLESRQSTTGSACASKTGGMEAWLQDNLGAFAANAPYEDFAKLIADFNGFEVRYNLTSTQLAHVFFEPGILDSPEAVSSLLMPLESRPPADTIAFVTECLSVAAQSGVNLIHNQEVRNMMFQAIFSKVKHLFTITSVSQYKDWFQNKLSLWLPSINASALNVLPRTVPCGVFKIIMTGLDGAFEQMSLDSRHDVYAFARRYLASKTSQGGDPCTENTRGSLGWLRANFGSFSSLASYKDLTDIHPDFSAMDAREAFTPTQLADYTLASDVLRDNEKAGKIVGSLTANNIGEFMDAVNTGAQEKKLSQLAQSETRRFMLGEIFCHLSSAFPLFTAKDYTLWFGERLRLFLSSLDAQNLGFIPSGTSCDSLAAIVGALTNYHVNNTFENPGDVASFIKRVLHFQLENSGSPCTQGVSADRQWLKTFFGPFSTSCSYTDFAELKSNFRGDDSLDLFSASALAQLSTQSRVIYNRSAVMLISEAIREKEDSSQYLGTYLNEFNDNALKNPGLLNNPKVQHMMLTFPAEMVFPQIDAMSPEDATAWLQRLRPLLPGINGTILDLLPRSMPCPYYQIVVKALVDVYSKLSTKKREEVYGFQKTYLAAQFADSGSACDSGTTGVRGWLMENLGDFCSVAKLNELQAFYPGLNAIENLSPVEAAGLTLVGPMCNSGFTSVVVGRIKTFKEYQSLHEYLCRLRSLHCQGSGSTASTFTCNGSSPLASVAPEIQRELFSNVLYFLKKQGASMRVSQWSDIAQLVQFEILPALNISYHSQPSASGPCEIFQATRDPNVTQGQEELREVFEICSSVSPQTENAVTSHVCGSTIYPTSGNTTLNAGSVTTPDPESPITPTTRRAVTSTTGRAITHTTNRATTYIPSRPAMFLYFPLIFWALATISN